MWSEDPLPDAKVINSGIVWIFGQQNKGRTLLAFNIYNKWYI